MTQIPIYRAKKIDSDEWFIGYLLKYSDGYYIKLLYISTEIMIDPSTLAIHFPNMIDKKGKKIFASLSEDGIGGDIVYIAGKGNCFLSFGIDGAYSTIIDNTKNIIDDLFPLSEALMENDVEEVIGTQLKG